MNIDKQKREQTDRFIAGRSSGPLLRLGVNQTWYSGSIICAVFFVFCVSRLINGRQLEPLIIRAGISTQKIGDRNVLQLQNSMKRTIIGAIIVCEDPSTKTSKSFGLDEWISGQIISIAEDDSWHLATGELINIEAPDFKSTTITLE